MGDRWHGLRFPFRKTTQGLFEDPSDVDLINSSIKFILNVQIGEYITFPEFGSKLPKDLFEQNDIVLKGLVVRHVTDSLTRWEPRISIVEVSAVIDDNELRLRVGYFRKDNPGPIRFFSDTFERQSV